MKTLKLLRLMVVYIHVIWTVVLIALVAYPSSQLLQGSLYILAVIEVLIFIVGEFKMRIR